MASSVKLSGITRPLTRPQADLVKQRELRVDSVLGMTLHIYGLTQLGVGKTVALGVNCLDLGPVEPG